LLFIHFCHKLFDDEDGFNKVLNTTNTKLYLTIHDMFLDTLNQTIGMSIIDRLQEKKWVILFVIYLRYLIGAAFVFASIVKIQGDRFTTGIGIDAPIHSALHFFETLYQSGLYWKFLGWSQLIVGFILMTQRFAALGALLFMPVSLNIFVITVSYDFGGTPVITGLMLLANIFLIIWDYRKFALMLNMKGNTTNNKVMLLDSFSGDKLWMVLGLLLFVATLVYVLILDRKPMLWFLICVAIGVTGIIISVMKNKA